MERWLQSKEFLEIINRHRRAPDVVPEMISTPVPITEDCSCDAFDIADNRNGGSILRNQGMGTAHYYNSPQEPKRNMRFIAYEHFVDSLGTDYNRGWSRVDFITYDTSTCKSYFIIHELSEGLYQNKRCDGIKQMQNTIRRLHESASIKNYIRSFQKRWCVLSVTEGIQQAPLDMTAGFNVIYDHLPDPLEIPAKSIESSGFKAFRTLNVKL